MAHNRRAHRPRILHPLVIIICRSASSSRCCLCTWCAGGVVVGSDSAAGALRLPNWELRSSRPASAASPSSPMVRPRRRWQSAPVAAHRGGVGGHPLVHRLQPEDVSGFLLLLALGTCRDALTGGLTVSRFRLPKDVPADLDWRGFWYTAGAATATVAATHGRSWCWVGRGGGSAVVPGQAQGRRRYQLDLVLGMAAPDGRESRALGTSDGLNSFVGVASPLLIVGNVRPAFVGLVGGAYIRQGDTGRVPVDRGAVRCSPGSWCSISIHRSTRCDPAVFSRC